MKLHIVATIIVVIVSIFGFKFQARIVSILRVGCGFTAKNVCSGRFISNRPIKDIVKYELEGLPSMFFDFQEFTDDNMVEAYSINRAISRLFGLPTVRAYYLGPSLGCQLRLNNMTQYPELTANYSADGSPKLSFNIDDALQQFIHNQFDEASLKSNHSRAIVVLHNGKVIAEGYQDKLSISHDTRLLGWSMTKTLHSLVVGAAIQAGLLSLESQPELIDIPSKYKKQLIEQNEGSNLTMADLLTMADILPFPEDYEITADIPRMLFTSHDHAAHAASVTTRKSIQPRPPQQADKWSSSQSLAELHKSHAVSENFNFYYSSGLCNIVAKELRAYFKSNEDYWRFPFTALLDKIGAASFAMEIDPSGTFVASSFSYATARDWARLGQLVLQQGEWDGQQVISRDFVKFLSTPRPGSGGHYGASVWMNPAHVDLETYHSDMRADHADKGRFAWLPVALPADALLLSGFDGQYVAIVPSLQLVVVRLGFTHDTPAPAPPTFSQVQFFSTIARRVQKLISQAA